jgi:RNA polymerase sigma factor (sigma-70 family)
MSESDWLAQRFEEHRGHLRAVAYRMLGTRAEADDAVQEAWLRLSRSDASAIDNLGAWLTTVVARVCLNMLRSRAARPEEPMGELPEPPAGPEGSADPEREALLADSVGLALLVVLDMLSPAERIAFVLHDTFSLPFEEIAPILDRSPEATRQLASRARRRVRGAPTESDADLARQREVVGAFLVAAREGDFAALLAVLDPEIVVRADRATIAMGSPPVVRGPEAVARNFEGRARAARPALIDGRAGAAWAPGGRTRVVFAFTITGGRIAAIDLVADPTRISELEVEIDYR